MLVQAVVVISAIALWLMLLAAIAESALRLVKGKRPGRPIFCTWRAGMIAAPFVIVAGIALTHFARLTNPEPGNPPLPCDHGTDYDTRDGLCYKRVPMKYQRR